MALPDKLSDLISYGSVSMSVSSREGKHMEFKEQFVKKAFSKYTKTLAAFSNADGGTLLFGVSDKPRKIVGIDADNFPDGADWVNQLKKDFDPEIEIETKDYTVNEMVLIAIQVQKSRSRPVICKRDTSTQETKKGKLVDASVLHQGIIYYRYSASSKSIDYADLSNLLAERDEQKLRSLLENIEIMGKLGLDKVGLMDATKSSDPDTETNLYVSKDTAKSLSFIDKGRIVEEEGAPAYVIAGKVKLNQIIERPIPDEDKILPTEAAERVKPTVQRIYGAASTFNSSHLTKLAKSMGVRDENETDTRYCIYDKAFDRYYYTPAGINHFIGAIDADPMACLRIFGSKAAIATYEQRDLGDI
jgi:hypothetical protein